MQISNWCPSRLYSRTSSLSSFCYWHFYYLLKIQTFVIMPMITLYLHLAKLLILGEWFFNSFLVLNYDKCQFMTLGTPDTLLNFKCKNITIQSSASENLLGLNIDSNKLDFMEKANLKLNALNRIYRFFVSRAACFSNLCLYKMFFQLLFLGLDVLLQGDCA